jgi:hypothetical protein
MHLPVELIQQIFGELATPIHLLQFGHKYDVLHALHQLRLASHTLHNISTPILYSSIVIAGHRDLLAFSRLSHALQHHCQALRLCFASNSTLSPLIADILRALSPNLRRLALDVPGNQLTLSMPVRDALKSCVHLEDYMRSGYSPMQLFPPPFSFWSGWTALRRLVLDGPLVDGNFIRGIAQLPHLTHLATIEPRWRYSDDGTEVAVFLDLLKAGRSIQRMLLIYCEATEYYLSSLKRLKGGVKGLKDELDVPVHYVIMREIPPKPMSLIRVGIGDGTLWELDSKSLLALGHECVVSYPPAHSG